jgi:NAD dependent epimerase/dehydratase family enzyme
MGRPSFMPAPAFALRLAMGEVATILLDGQRALPQALLDAGFKFQYPELQPALTDLLR